MYSWIPSNDCMYVGELRGIIGQLKRFMHQFKNPKEGNEGHAMPCLACVVHTQVKSLHGINEFLVVRTSGLEIEQYGLSLWKWTAFLISCVVETPTHL